MSKAPHIAFTICSNNYLGQALALKSSFLEHNPEFGFYIVLVDTLSDQIDYSLCEPAVVLPASQLKGVDLEELISRYYIIELNTAVKASAFKHIISEHPEAQAIYYLDPDLYFYNSLQETNLLLQKHSAVLTPHILSPIDRDGKKPDENTFMRFGIYNLGFIGLNARHQQALKMLDWWEERSLQFGYDRPHKGYFVDQLWMVFLPLFYKDVYILKTYNYNMAPWNLHERSITSIHDNNVLLNDGSKLVFYHFSKLSDNPNDISREYNRYTFAHFPLLQQLYKAYKAVLDNCNYLEYKNIAIGYKVKVLDAPKVVKRSLPSKIFKKMASILSRIGDKL